MHTNEIDPQKGRIQGRDEILINTPIEKVWPLIGNSKMLEAWGPPVKKIEVLYAPGETIEGVGTKRKVHAQMGNKTGFLLEHRSEHIEGKKIAYKIDEDSFGIKRVLKNVGFSMELERINEKQTKFIFTFYQDPKGIFGWLMNPLVKVQQRKNRMAALHSIKKYAETH